MVRGSDWPWTKPGSRLPTHTFPQTLVKQCVFYVTRPHSYPVICQACSEPHILCTSGGKSTSNKHECHASMNATQACITQACITLTWHTLMRSKLQRFRSMPAQIRPGSNPNKGLRLQADQVAEGPAHQNQNKFLIQAIGINEHLASLASTQRKISPGIACDGWLQHEFSEWRM